MEPTREQAYITELQDRIDALNRTITRQDRLIDFLLEKLDGDDDHIEITFGDVDWFQEGDIVPKEQ